MQNYSYQARNASGQMVKGEMQAESTRSVADMLIHEKLVPISIKIVSHGQNKKLREFLDRMATYEIIPTKIPLNEKTMFCRQMYSLLIAGVPLVQAINEVQKNILNKMFKFALHDINKRLEGGSTIAAAMKLHPRVFSTIFISLCEAGEESGKLTDAFKQMISHFELEEKTAKQFSAATRYPMMLLGVMVVAMVVINIFVIPGFRGMFEQNNMNLPLMTRILIGSSDFFVHYWGVMLFIIILAVSAFNFYVKTPEGSYQVDYFKMRLPLIGGILHRILLGRFARVFAMMLESGVPLSKSIFLTANAMDNHYFKTRLKLMQKVIEHGDSLTKAATSSELFSVMTLQMLNVGEASGKVESMLSQIADFYEREVDYELGKLSSAIEPIIAAFMGGMVLVLALGIFLPMWGMVNLVK